MKPASTPKPARKSAARWRVERMSLRGPKGIFYGSINALVDFNRDGEWEYVSCTNGLDGKKHSSLKDAKKRVEDSMRKGKR